MTPLARRGSRVLAALLGAATLLGCDANTQSALLGTTPSGVAQFSGYVWGQVVDRYGRPLAGAKVTDGAAVFYTSDGVQTDFKADNGQNVTLARGEFFLTRSPAGQVRTLTATYDSLFSANAVQVFVPASAGTTSNDRTSGYVAGGTAAASPSTPIVLNTGGPLNGSPINTIEVATISFTTLAATGSFPSTPGPMTNIAYANNGGGYTPVARVTVVAPPGSNGVTIHAASYSLDVGTVTNFASQPLQSDVLVPTGTVINSGTRTNVTVDLSQFNGALGQIGRPTLATIRVTFFDTNGNPVVVRSGVQPNQGSNPPDATGPLTVPFVYRYGI